MAVSNQSAHDIAYAARWAHYPGTDLPDKFNVKGKVTDTTKGIIFMKSDLDQEVALAKRGVKLHNQPDTFDEIVGDISGLLNAVGEVGGTALAGIPIPLGDILTDATKIAENPGSALDVLESAATSLVSQALPGVSQDLGLPPQIATAGQNLISGTQTDLVSAATEVAGSYLGGDSSDAEPPPTINQPPATVSPPTLPPTDGGVDMSLWSAAADLFGVATAGWDVGKAASVIFGDVTGLSTPPRIPAGGNPQAGTGGTGDPADGGNLPVLASSQTGATGFQPNLPVEAVPGAGSSSASLGSGDSTLALIASMRGHPITLGRMGGQVLKLYPAIKHHNGTVTPAYQKVVTARRMNPFNPHAFFRALRRTEALAHWARKLIHVNKAFKPRIVHRGRRRKAKSRR